MRTLLFFLLAVGLVYVVICAALYWQQDSLLFFPSRASAADLNAVAARNGFQPWLDLAGRTIGWESKDGDPSHPLIVCHGNAGDALGRIPYENYCHAGGGNRRIYLLEYPGYGSREGQPSETALTAAAVDGIDALAKPGTDIWLLGESLGTGVACATVAARPQQIAALILVAPFDSLVGAAASHYPWVPVALLLRTRFDSEANLQKYPGPVAFIIAGHDQVVPSRLGRKLYNSYSGPKHFWEIAGAEHNDLPTLLADWPSVAAWLSKNQIH